MNHDVLLLDDHLRTAVTTEIERLSGFRGWKLWMVNARSNHVHIVVTAIGSNGAKMRGQIKANCTHVVRELCHAFVGRPVWTVGGDWQCIKTEAELERVILYAGDAQDRKERDIV